MKRLLAIMCALVMTFSCAACSQSGGGKEQPETPGVSGVQATAGLEGEIGGEIRVSVFNMQYKSFLDAAAAAFVAKYPNVTVNVDALSVMPEIKTFEGEGMTGAMITIQEDAGEKNDYINKISTELMSGKGADILAMDVLPYYKYADNGQLMDLQAFINADAGFNEADYRANIWNSTLYGKNRYLIPIGYSFDFYTYDTTLFDDADAANLTNKSSFSYEQIIELGAVPFEKYNKDTDAPAKLMGISDVDLFFQMFRENISTFVDMSTKTVNFANGAFTKLLTSAKSYADMGYVEYNSAVRQASEEVRFGTDAMENMLNQRYFFKSQNVSTLMQHFNKNSNIRMYSPGMGNTDDDELIGVSADENGNIPFTFTQAYAMNANSQNQRTAWEFLKFLLSDEMQTSFYMMEGLPINNNAREKKAKQDIANSSVRPGMSFSPNDTAGVEGGNAGSNENNQPVGERTGDIQPGAFFAGAMPIQQNTGPVELDEEQQAVYDKYAEAIEKYSDMLNMCYIEDSTVAKIIEDEVRAYFDGTKTADDIANVLQNKVSLYINE